MTEVFATFISARTATLSFLWVGVVVCSGLLPIAAVLGVVFRSRRFWGAAVILIVVDLALAVSVAVLDRFGFR